MRKFCEFRTELLFILRNISYTPGSFGSVVFCSVFLWRLLNRFCFAMIMRFSAISFCLAFPFLLPLNETLAQATQPQTQGSVIYVDGFASTIPRISSPEPKTARPGRMPTIRWRRHWKKLKTLEAADDGHYQIWVTQRRLLHRHTRTILTVLDEAPHFACFTVDTKRERLFGGFPYIDALRLRTRRD